MMRSNSLIVTYGLSLSLMTAMASAAKEAIAFVNGAPLIGGTNGMYFDLENNLWVAQALGRTISKLNPLTGEILEQLGTEEGVRFADDVTVGPDGTLYWTDVFLGTLFQRAPGGVSLPLYPPQTYPGANPLTLSDDGARLFFAQCFNLAGPNGLYQLDLTTNETTSILENITSCASNAMDFRNESLYSPRPFEGRVVRIDLANNNAVTNVSTGMENPVAVKFDSQGQLYAVDYGLGKVFRIDLENPDTTNNREVVAEPPFAQIDNLAFDKDDRLYISSFARGTVLEVLNVTDFRTVSPGSFSATSGVAVVDDIVYTINPLAMHGYDADGQEVYFYASAPGDEDFLQPTTIVMGSQENTVLHLSFLLNTLVVWDLDTSSALLLASFQAPVDAHPFGDGYLVTEAATGDIVQATGADLSERKVIATLSGPSFLAGDNDNVYAADLVSGLVVQIIADGAVLDPPETVSSGHVAPEGIALAGKDRLLVVAVGAGTLEQVDLATGNVSVVADGLIFLPGLPDVGLVFGYCNDVSYAEGYAYVNGDGENVIYKIEINSTEINSGCAVIKAGLLVMGLALVPLVATML